MRVVLVTVALCCFLCRIQGQEAESAMPRVVSLEEALRPFEAVMPVAVEEAGVPQPAPRVHDDGQSEEEAMRPFEAVMPAEVGEVGLAQTAPGLHGDSESEAEMLVRCKRPMCRMFCAYGFKTGKDGCPVCQCEDNPCETVECPSGLFCRPKRCHGGPCPIPEAECVELPTDCRMYKCVPCEYGYFKDQHGCQTCECLPAKEPIGLRLPEEGVDPVLPCPMPMCANPCPLGYKNDERGCMTCECQSTPQEHTKPNCQDQACEEDLVCYMRTPALCDEGCEPVPVCTAPSLCHSMTRGLEEIQSDDVPHAMALPLQCREDGTFEPTQCNDVTHECWCVDDRGRPIEQSRSTTNVGLSCQMNMTSVLHVNFEVTHDFAGEDIVITLQSGSLHAVIKKHFSRWIGIKEENVVIAAVIPMEGKLLIHVILMQDGITDLPSAANHLGNQMRRGNCAISYQDRKLIPNADSVKVHHQYTAAPHLPSQGVRQYEGGMKGLWRHSARVIVYCMGVAIILIIIITLGAYVFWRRRMTHLQFAHRKLKNMNMFKENLRISTEWDHPDLIVAEKEAKEVELLTHSLWETMGI